MTPLIVIGVIVLLLGILIWMPITLQLTLTRKEKENEGFLKIKLGFIPFSIPLNAKEAEEDTKQEAEEEDKPKKKLETGFFSKIKEKIVWYHALYVVIKEDIEDILRFLAQKGVKVSEVSLHLDFGFADPAMTGIMTGVFNGIAYNILAMLHRHLTIQDWEITIQPDFEHELFDSRFLCIAKTRLAYIITASTKVVRLYFKIRKYRRKSNGTSDSGAHGHSNEQH